MRSHTITSEPGKFAEEFREKERKRAFKALEGADSFVVITKKGGGNDCIASIEGDHVKMMAFNCHIAEEQIIKSIKEEK